jgi:hypothetical protein
MEPIYTCTRCSHTRPLSDVILEAIGDEAFSSAVQAAANLPPILADQVIRYMRLFGAIRLPARAKLLTDLVEAINTGKFIHKRREYRATPALWMAAFNDTLASKTIRLPLKAANGHGFLYAIAADKADRTAAAAEQFLEDPARTGIPTSPPSNIPDPRRRALEQDVAHWERLANMRPDDASLQANLTAARTRLATEFPPEKSTNV